MQTYHTNKLTKEVAINVLPEYYITRSHNQKLKISYGKKPFDVSSCTLPVKRKFDSLSVQQKPKIVTHTCGSRGILWTTGSPWLATGCLGPMDPQKVFTTYIWSLMMAIPPCSHMIAFWALRNQPEFINICSIPWSYDHDLWLLLFFLLPVTSFTSGFQQETPTADNGFT